MFKALFEFRESYVNGKVTALEASPEVMFFFENIKKFAFFRELNMQCEAKGSDIESLVKDKKYDIVISNLLDENGLNYGKLPKGLLTFHNYRDKTRTAFEEHLVEGARYAESKGGTVYMHFTVSPEHLDSFKRLSDNVLKGFEERYQVSYTIDYSIQKPSTDTMAATADNTPFYNEDGSILFRPGGHGALLANLNDIDADIIYIKNIDNVVPESKITPTVESKRILAGMLLDVRNQVFEVLEELTKNPLEETITVATEILKNTFNLEGACIPENGGTTAIVNALVNRLNRPIRVCGVVKNLGEPGGGPFLTRNENGCISPQIVETSQVDLKKPDQRNILSSSTHFNPVDLVCSVKDFKGKKFDLNEFVDEGTCFVSKKSISGKELKALELPGLWNGAMAGWNTIFVEVPIETFNPVKTVNDLVRDMHQ